jgi:hypothetical protein
MAYFAIHGTVNVTISNENFVLAAFQENRKAHFGASADTNPKDPLLDFARRRFIISSNIESPFICFSSTCSFLPANGRWRGMAYLEYEGNYA